MRFSQGNQPIEAPSADGPDDSFANRISRWTSRRGFQYFDPELHNRLVEVSGKNTIAIMQQVFVPILQPDGLTQLLQRPHCTRMGGHIAVNQASGAMLDHHEYIQLSKGYSDGEEKVTGNDPLGVQAKKG